MRKGIMSLSLPGMRKKRKAGSAATTGQAMEKKTAHEEPKVEAKAEKPFVQTINVPKPNSSHTARHKRITSKKAARKTDEKK